MKNISKWVVDNYFLRKAYSCKFYLGLGISQVSWFTGKLPEIMSFIFITEWLGFELSQNSLIVFFVGAVFGLTLGGYLWKHSGLYDTEMNVNASKNPVSYRMLRAANIIIKKYDQEKEEDIKKCKKNCMR